MQIRTFKILFLLLSITFFKCDKKQETPEKTTVKYTISFENAVHHEAEISVSFSSVPLGNFEFRMPRSSPGRYAIHEFAKNVYNVKATNYKGDILQISRPNPYAWIVENHDGFVNVSYTLFANRGDGTYAQIDETHAHLNMPATFMFANSMEENPVEITFNPRKDLNWKIATQLKKETENRYSAPNFQYFMDSPTELSNHTVKTFTVDTQKINFVLHDEKATTAQINEYFEGVKNIVLQQKAVFGELPNFDFNEYTFLACYTANASGDGMEHRNSTILTSTRSLAANGMDRNIGTVSHEFFHAWNVERLRPKALEPFNFEAANMSGELWFAEGFTSYYTNLILARANIISPEEYVARLNGTFNYVWNSPGTQFFNPIEMSYQAPFVDAATSVDPVNRENTFISYYSYGSVLGLALDLSLRKEGKNLDEYMKLLWVQYGKDEKPYTIKNLNDALNEFAGNTFGNQFFENYIYKSNMPNYEELFVTVGVLIEQNSTKTVFENSVNGQNITKNSKVGTNIYKANLTKGDKILAINNIILSDEKSVSSILKNYAINDEITITFERFGNQKTTKLMLQKDPTYFISAIEKNKINEDILMNRNNWLQAK